MRSENPRWRRRPEGSNWGDFGADDELGRVNLIDASRVLAGIAEVKAGKTFCLSLPLDIGYWLNPGRRGPTLNEVAAGDGKPMMNYPLRRLDERYTDVTSDDGVTLDLQFSTQWDSLGHVGGLFDADGDGVAEPVYYNGFRAHEHVHSTMDYRDGERPSGSAGNRLDRLGIDNLATAGMQGRGVLVDLAHHFGPEPWHVGFDDWRRVIEADDIAVAPGDMLCVRTGSDEVILAGAAGAPLPEAHPGPVIDGRDERMLQWIADSGVAAIASDHPAVEAWPPRPGGDCVHALLPLHELCLFKLGIPLGEMWLLSPLARWLRASGRHAFLLTAPPLRLPGAAGSPVTPIATV